jgi:hypothetical protein
VHEKKKEAAHQFEVAELRRKAKDFHQPRPVGWNKPAIHRRYTERRFFCIPYRYLQGITMRPVIDISLATSQILTQPTQTFEVIETTG